MARDAAAVGGGAQASLADCEKQLSAARQELAQEQARPSAALGALALPVVEMAARSATACHSLPPCRKGNEWKRESRAAEALWWIGAIAQSRSEPGPGRFMHLNMPAAGSFPGTQARCLRSEAELAEERQRAEELTVQLAEAKAQSKRLAAAAAAAKQQQQQQGGLWGYVSGGSNLSGGGL